MFACEGTHRGSVYRRSVASSQVLFLLERSLTYHCAWHLRLAESWMPIRLPAVGSAHTFLSESAWLLAVASELRLSPHSVCVVTRALATELLLSPLAACGFLESVCLLSFARHWCRNPAGTTRVVRPCFLGLQADVCISSVLRGRVLPLRSLGLQGQSPLGCFALIRLATPAVVAAYADPVPRGQRAPLDEFRALLIDRSAGLVESFLPSRSRTWRRSREHQSSAHGCSHLETHLEAADLDAVLAISESGGACCPSWALTLLLLKSRSASSGVSLTLTFSCHIGFSELVVFWMM